MTHALISFEQHGKNMRIVAIGSESDMLDKHDATPIGGGVFHSVRPVDHEMTLRAAREMADKLGPKQRAALAGLAKVTPAGRTIMPGSRTPSRRVHVPGFADSTDLIAPAKGLEAKGFVVIGGVPFAPKTFRMTALGRVVGTVINTGI